MKRLMVATSGLPRIIVLGLGGTIASTRSQAGGATPQLTAEQLVAAVPVLGQVAEIVATSFRMLPSPALTVSDLIALSHEVRAKVKEGAAGVVVTQGTDTLEETAFALDLLTSLEVPVVVTGAMRPPDQPGADGPANLLAAVQVAAAPAARNLGTLVVVNDEIHAARFVQKSHTSNPGAFRSPLTGPIGWVIEGHPRIAMRPLGRGHVNVAQETPVPSVALLTVGMGDDGRLALSTLEAGYAGLVVEGTGGGHVPGEMALRLGEVATKIPVVFSSRTGCGEILRKTYGLFPGSEVDLLQRGLIAAGMLDGIKARMLLTLLLMAGANHAEVREVFGRAGVPGEDWSFP